MLEKIIQWIKRWVGVGKVHTENPTPPKGNGAPPNGKDTGKNNPNVKTRSPHDIGGQRGTQRQKNPPSPNNNSRRVPTPRPELICREAQGTQKWEVILSVPKECNVETVRHDNKHLEALNGEYCPSSLTGCLSVEYTDCKKTDTFSLYDDKPMIFKLKGDWAGDGRKIDGITKGCFIVIAQSEWERTGRIPIEPAYCTDIGFKAHYLLPE